MISILSYGQETKKADNILGTYRTANKDAKVKIFKKNGNYYGKVIWLRDPLDQSGKPILDKNNPIQSKRTKPLLNLILISNLSYKNGEWVGGTIYDPKNGKSYDCILWLENGDLKVRGYVGWFFDTKTWKKLN